MNGFILGALSATLITPTALFAEPATQSGADDLAIVFESFVGSRPGTVTVSPQGDTYAVSIDPAMALSAISFPGFEFEISRLDITLTDMGNGSWSYVLDQPIVFTYSLPGEVPVTTKTSYGSVRFTGVFDEALGASSNSRFVATDIATTSTQQDPVFGPVTSTQNIALQVSESTAKPGASGVDVTVHGTSSGLTGEMMLPIPEVGLLPISTEVVEVAFDAKISGLQSRELYAFWAWLIAQPNVDAIEANPLALKAAIEATLPMFTSVEVFGGLSDVSASTPVGEVLADSVTFNLDMTGITTDAHLHDGFAVKGLVLPDGLVPEFAQALVPTDFSIGLTVSDFDLSGAAYVGLKLLEQPIGSPPPAGFEEALLASLLPTGAVTFTLESGVTEGAAYRLSYEGALTAGPAAVGPTFAARIGLTGMEAVRAALQSAPPEMELGALAMGLGAMGGLAKPGDSGELVWEISLDEAGTVLVNGVDPEKLFPSP